MPGEFEPDGDLRSSAAFERFQQRRVRGNLVLDVNALS